MAEGAAGYRAMKEGLGAFDLARDVISASGPEAETYLQGQLSQDVAALAVGESAWSLVLAPAGRVDCLARVTRLEPEVFVLDTDGGFGEALAARLSRFKLRTKVEFAALEWRTVALRGPGVASAAVAAGDGTRVVADASWPGLPGVDLMGPDPRAPGGAVAVAPEAFEAARVEAGVPVMGAELTERTIPAEAGIVSRTVSFTKGCYTGQELVARIDSRGSNVARRLRGLLLDGPVEPGTALEAGGKEAGWVTSVARSPAMGWVALGYVGRGVEPGSEVTAGQRTATVTALPMTRE